jgi:hypothetical protein
MRRIIVNTTRRLLTPQSTTSGGRVVASNGTRRMVSSSTKIATGHSRVAIMAAATTVGITTALLMKNQHKTVKAAPRVSNVSPLPAVTLQHAHSATFLSPFPFLPHHQPGALSMI